MRANKCDWQRFCNDVYDIFLVEIICVSVDSRELLAVTVCQVAGSL